MIDPCSYAEYQWATQIALGSCCWPSVSIHWAALGGMALSRLGVLLRIRLLSGQVFLRGGSRWMFGVCRHLSCRIRGLKSPGWSCHCLGYLVLRLCLFFMKLTFGKTVHDFYEHNFEFFLCLNFHKYNSRLCHDDRTVYQRIPSNQNQYYFNHFLNHQLFANHHSNYVDSISDKYLWMEIWSLCLWFYYWINPEFHIILGHRPGLYLVHLAAQAVDPTVKRRSEPFAQPQNYEQSTFWWPPNVIFFPSLCSN